MTATPYVSVVIPAFNAAQTIAEAIASVRAQTFADVELVICDDASTDDTAAIIKGFTDSRIKLLRNDVNRGVGASRDRAIAEARGDWVAMLDADDAWEPQRLERLLAAAGNRNDCMVFDDIMTCHDTPRGLVAWKALRGTSAFGTRSNFARNIEFVDFLRSERLLIHPLIPTHFIREHSIRHSSRRFGEDSEFFVHLAYFGLNFVYLPEPLYLYRLTPGSATGVNTGTQLMRECIAECATWEWTDEAVRAAFRFKIDALKNNELLYELSACGKRFDVTGCIALLFRNPRIFRILPRRALRHLAYQAHRIVHSGRPR